MIPSTTPIPSGKRALVPLCDFYHPRGIFSSKFDTYPNSKVADALAVEIQWAYKVSPITSDRRLHILDVVNVYGYEYGVIDLFDSLPASFWGKVQAQPNDYPGQGFLNALNQDQVVSAFGSGDKTWVTFTDPQQSLVYWATNGAKTFLAAIAEAGGKFWELTSSLAASVARVVLAGLAALLKQAQQLPGFGDLNPDTFVNLLDKFQEVGSLAYTAVSNAPKLAATFVNGAWGGLKSFLENIPDRLKTVFFQWLSSGLKADGQTVPDLPTQWDDLPSIGTFALELMGLGSDDLLGLMVQLDLPGSQYLGSLLGAYELIEGAIDGGLEGATDLFSAQVTKFVGDDSDLTAAVAGLGSGDAVPLTDIYTDALKAGAQVAQKALLDALLKKLFTLLLKLAANPLVGALWDAAYAIYKIIVFVIQELEQLKALVTKVIQGVTALLNFDEEGVSQRVDQGLTAVVGILFKFLMGFLSLDQLPVWVAEAISALRNGVQNLLKKLMGALLGVGLRLLGAVGSVLPDDEQGRMTKKVAAKSDPSVTVWLQEQKNGDVVVMAEASKKEPLLKKLESQAGTSGQGCATSGGKPSAGILAKLNATETKGKVLKNEVRKAEKPPPKTKGPKVAKPKKQVQKQKKEAEKDLPALAEAAAQKKKATSGCGCGTATNSGGGKSKGSKGGGTCIDIGTEVRFLGKRENLGQSRVGRRIKGEGSAPSKEPDREWLRLVRLELDYGDGNGLEAELLRGVDWLAENLAIEGSVLWLDLPEVGLSGWATVRTIAGCPGLEEGEGPLVTGWFKHRSGTVYDLVIAGEAKRIGITGTHPVWSVDRQDWVPAAELQEGERLLADDGGTPVVVSLSLRGCNEPVYNIEVDGDHCCRVGQQGLLVHNASAGPTPCDSLGSQRRNYSYRQFRIPERHGSSNWITESVVDRAVSWIRRADFPGGSKTGPDEQDWVQHVVGVDESMTPPPGHIDAAGHIVARELGGSGHLQDRPLNLFPQNYGLNWNPNGWWRQREKEIEMLFTTGCPEVCVRIVLRYDRMGRYPARPTYLIYDVWVDGVQRPTAQGDNLE